MKQITHHHDGHGLAEAITLNAKDAPGPGGAHHLYHAFIEVASGDPDIGRRQEPVLFVQYQKGPRNEPGSTPGVLDSVLLAIVKDRMESFQAGPYASPYNARVLSGVDAALGALKDRADERAVRGVLGKNQK